MQVGSGTTLHAQSPSIFLDKSLFPTYLGRSKETLRAGHSGTRFHRNFRVNVTWFLPFLRSPQLNRAHSALV